MDLQDYNRNPSIYLIQVVSSINLISYLENTYWIAQTWRYHYSLFLLTLPAISGCKKSCCDLNHLPINISAFETAMVECRVVLYQNRNLESLDCRVLPATFLSSFWCIFRQIISGRMTWGECDVLHTIHSAKPFKFITNNGGTVVNHNGLLKVMYWKETNWL